MATSLMVRQIHNLSYDFLIWFINSPLVAKPGNTRNSKLRKNKHLLDSY